MIIPDWPTCNGSERCQGIQIEGFGRCLRHMKPDDLDRFFDDLDHRSALDARGTTIDTNLATRLSQPGLIIGALNLGQAEFGEATYVALRCADRLTLSWARFEQHVRLALASKKVSTIGTRFENGVTMSVSGELNAEHAVFDGPSTISSGSYGPPPLISLREVDVGNLVLVDMDLSWCLFAGAHRLDQLRFEGDCWTKSPPVPLKGTRRVMLAEEIISHRHVVDPYNRHAAISIDRTAVLYRSLRKALEDSKNEAGAGDFYYGEMEMRRRAPSTQLSERLILWAYWLLSGYGQRAGRAIAALGVLVAVVCALLFTVGLPGEVVWTWWRVDQSLRIGMGAVVFREAGQTLTSAGSWTVMVARFAGPVLLALAVLAIRARVKR